MPLLNDRASRHLPSLADPCASPTACGTNAQCSVVSHRVQCTCPAGTTGDAYSSCRAPPKACEKDEQCDDGTCYGGVCVAKCSRQVKTTYYRIVSKIH